MEQEQTKEFKAITTQEDLNRIVEGRLGQERKKYADYDELKDKLARYDELMEKLAVAESKISEFEKAAQLSAWRVEVRGKYKLPESVDPLLTGSTFEEMQVQAAAILECMPKTGRPVVPGDTGKPLDIPQGSGLVEFAKEQIGRQ